MIPALFFQNHTVASVYRPERAFGASTLDVRLKWSVVSGMSGRSCMFQPRGQQPFASDVGVIYDESASLWLDADVLPSAGEILTGDRVVVQHPTGSDTTWDVVDSKRIEQGGIDRMWQCTLRKVNAAA